MKKLMFMLAAVAFAVGVQAAQVSWSMTVANKGVDWSGAGAYVMAFNGSDYSDVIKLLTVDGSDNMATDLGAYALSGASGTQFNVSNSRGSAKVSSGDSTGVTGDKMFFVVFTEGSMDANKAITWTDAINVSTYTYEAGSPQPGILGLNAASFTNSGTIANVPEPTSGLLLLVGMAGLALRHKQK